MTVRIVARKMAGGARHEHIVAVKWKNEASGNEAESSRTTMVEWLEKDKANTAYVSDDRGNRSLVGVRRRDRGASCIQTFADGEWTHNLLALPTFE